MSRSLKRTLLNRLSLLHSGHPLSVASTVTNDVHSPSPVVDYLTNVSIRPVGCKLNSVIAKIKERALQNHTETIQKAQLSLGTVLLKQQHLEPNPPPGMNNAIPMTGMHTHVYMKRTLLNTFFCLCDIQVTLRRQLLPLPI